MSTSIHILISWVDVEEIDRISTRQISKTLKEKITLKQQKAVVYAGNHLPRLLSLQISDQFPE